MEHSSEVVRVMPLGARRAEATRDWPKPTDPGDAEELRKWVIHGDYSNVFEPWHSLIEEWEDRDAGGCTFNVQVYDHSWGGWRRYDGLAPEDISKGYAQRLAKQASERSTYRWRVVDAEGEQVTEYRQGRAAR